MTDLATLAIKISTDGANRTNNDLRSVERASKQTEKAVDSLSLAVNALKRLMALGIGIQGISGFIQMADKMQSLRTQVQFVTGSMAELNKVQQELFDISQRTSSSLESTTQLYVRTSRALKDYGVSQRQVLQFTETINKAMAVGGVNAQAQASALMQLSQALGSGQLQGDEFKAIAESAPIILDVVAEYMGKSRAEIKKIASEGKITSQLLFNAINSSTQKINKQFEGMPLTFGQAMQQMENAALKFVGDLDSANGISGLLAQGISFLAQNFTILAKAISYATVAYIAYNTASFVSNFKKAAGGIGILSASFGYLTNMIRGATVAMMANPIGLIAVAITGAAFAFDTFISDIEVGASTLDATWGDVAVGVWNDFKDVVSETADWFSVQWDKAIASASSSFDSLPGLIGSVAVNIIDLCKQSINAIIALFVGGFNAIKVAWSNLPAAFSSIGKTAINGLIKIVEGGLNYLLDGIKSFLGVLNSAMEAVGLNAIFDTSDWKIELPKVELNEAEAQIKDQLGGAFKEAFSRDYVGEAVNSLSNYIEGAAIRGKIARKIDEGAGSSQSTGANNPLVENSSGKNNKGSHKKGEDHLKAWKAHYNELERANADSWTRIALEEERSMREMLEKAKNANVGYEEIEKAKTLIYERYAKERQEIAEKYAPELKFKRELEEQLKEIQQLEKGGRLTGTQADQARDNARWSNGEAIAKQAGQNAVSGYDRWKEQFDPMQAIKNEQTTKLAELQSFYDQGLIQYEDFTDAKALIDAKATADTQNLFMDSISGFGSAIDTMLGVMRNAGQEQSSIYRAMFAASKAFAIADSIVQITNAIAKASNAPFPENIGAMATVASQTASIVSTIQSVTLQGMAHSGIDNVPSEGTWLLDKGERVVDSRTNADLKTFLANQQKGQSGNQRASVNVKIINNGQPVNANVESKETENGLELTVTLLKKMESVASEVYTKRQAQDMRAGGVFTRR
ncbi:tape measure protein [Ursidibacter arcticus]